jgi:hypothetical protein
MNKLFIHTIKSHIVGLWFAYLSWQEKEMFHIINSEYKSSACIQQLLTHNKIPHWKISEAKEAFSLFTFKQEVSRDFWRGD